MQRLMLAAAEQLQPLDPGLARQTYLDAFSTAQFAARFNGGVGTVEVAMAARSALRQPEEKPTHGDALLAAFVELADDYATGVPSGQGALTMLRDDPEPAMDRPRWLWQGCVLALELCDDESAYVLSDRHLRLARQTGALSELPLALGSRTPVPVFCGEMEAATSLVAEARSVHEAAGIAEAPYSALVVTAWRGRTRECEELLGVTIGEATANALDQLTEQEALDGRRELGLAFGPTSPRDLRGPTSPSVMRTTLQSISITRTAGPVGQSRALRVC